MIRLYVVVEGQTEERFVKRVLGPHLDTLAVHATPIIVTTRRDSVTGRKIGRGGGGRWGKWRNDLHRLMKGQRGNDVRFTTLFDLYALPRDFPGMDLHGALPDTVKRASMLEQAMEEDLGDRRLIPYLQRHEFKALVLAGLEELERLLDHEGDLAGLRTLKAEIGQRPPEDVNEGPQTAPSARLEARIASYDKTVHGPLVVEAIGLERLRARCVRFGEWLARLEGLAP